LRVDVGALAEQQLNYLLVVSNWEVDGNSLCRLNDAACSALPNLPPCALTSARNALQAASAEGRKEMVQMLLDKNADVNAQGGEYGNALQAASAKGHKEVVQMLLNKNADINAQGGKYGNALQLKT
jgi:ankyrin repeat protein